ncbi:MAG: hypothetical protein Q9182_003204 [Xanthomendoza sp. 2 TL-2023]
MQSLISVLLFLGLVPFTLAGYRVQDDYSGDKFLDMFTFDTMDDPTHGYVNYIDQSQARREGLLDVDNGAVILRADSTNVASGRGRNSLRLTSKAKYNHGLIVVDLAHMPGNACGVWPSFWMVGPQWPDTGEIDIIEGVNLQSENQMTMHTNAGCSLAGSSCLANKGCPAKGGAFGDTFNNNNGGIYATEWTAAAIKIWFFPHGGQSPPDILSRAPDPTRWGPPTATFQGGPNCKIDSHFKDQHLVFDTTFCGDWAGAPDVWSRDPTCAAKAPSCRDFVRDHPEAFREAFWTVKALKVYSLDSAAAPQESASANEPSSPPLSSLLPPASTITISQPNSHSGRIPTPTSFIDGGAITVTVDPGFKITHTVTAEAVRVTMTAGRWSGLPGRRRRRRRHFGGGLGGR